MTQALKWKFMSLRPTVVSAVLFASIGGGTATTSLIGQASVIDGDTLEIHPTRIRLWGIDAPESS